MFFLFLWSLVGEGRREKKQVNLFVYTYHGAISVLFQSISLQLDEMHLLEVVHLMD